MPLKGERFKITSDIISKRALYAALVLFVLITLFRLAYFYWEMQQNKRALAKAGAQTLSALTMAHREYYQQMFLKGHIELSEKTLPALPAFSSYDISQRFSKRNIFNIDIQTVSDRARNARNRADNAEMKAIAYFKAHPEAKEYFTLVENGGEGDYYQYALPLKIERKCLKCHGERDKAPAFIRKRYDNAYGYRLGEIRGVLSIKTPESKISAFLAPSFYLQAAYDLLLFIVLFFLVRYLILKFRDFSHRLEEDVEARTNELRGSIRMLDEYKRALDESAIVSKGDIDGNITYVNEAFCRITGYTKDEVLGKNHNILRHPDTTDDFYDNMWATLLQKRPWHGLLKNRTKHGETFYVEANIFPILGVDSQIREFIAVRYDVSELMQKRQEIERSYTVDKLTGLPNRNRFLEDLSGIPNANVALINIDSFKDINDFFGIESGDDLLVQVSKQLSVLKDDTLFGLYRLHADEFAVLGRGRLETEAFVTLVSHYAEALEKAKFYVGSERQEISLSVSVGFGSGEHAHIKADMALKLAKTQKRPFFVYDEAMRLESLYEKNIRMAKTLRNAIEQGDIVACYQPIMNLKTGRVEKYEALMRLREDGRLIGPDEFIGVAKRTKQYFRLTRRMVEQVIGTLKRHENLSISINLSIEDLIDQQMLSFLKTTLYESGLAHRLVFEILESESIDNYDEVIEAIHDLKGYGASLAIDDFGSGYSNFVHVMQLGVDFIKIDGSLIRNIDEDNHSRVLVEGIVEFSRRLGLSTIAEFVESEAVLAVLETIGVDYAQGYYVGRPSLTID